MTLGKTKQSDQIGRATKYQVSFRDIYSLRPSEEIAKDHASSLAAKIRGEGYWTSSIPIEAGSGVIMDGNHRFQSALELGLTRLPVILLSYDQPCVAVFFQRHSDTKFPLEEIQNVIKSGTKLPYKTTRHVFNPSLPKINLPLSLLVAS